MIGSATRSNNRPTIGPIADHGGGAEVEPRNCGGHVALAAYYVLCMTYSVQCTSV